MNTVMASCVARKSFKKLFFSTASLTLGNLSLVGAVTNYVAVFDYPMSLDPMILQIGFGGESQEVFRLLMET